MRTFKDIEVGDIVVAYDESAHDYTEHIIKIDSITIKIGGKENTTKPNMNRTTCYGTDLEEGKWGGNRITVVTEGNFVRFANDEDRLEIHETTTMTDKDNNILEELKNWTLSEYNEDTDDQLDYYINERKCDIGDKAYLYSHEDNMLTKMEIIHIISRTDDMEFYDRLMENEDVLLDGEDEYNADTSAEFITDNDCYLVWFKYV